MGFLNTLKEVMTNKPSTLREPTFIKEFNEENKQLKDLEELLKVAPEDVYKEINGDIKLLSYGMLGEKNVAYELKHSHMPILILHDLYLEYNGLTAQIDYVVISPKFLLVIECKNMVGDIEITSNGDFIRYFKSSNGKVYKKEGIYSPIVQNERHVEIITDILKTEYKFGKSILEMVKHVVTVANPKTVINSKYANKKIKEHIIKHEQLINKMKELNEENKDGHWFTEETMYNIANSLLKYNSTYVIDYEKKYGVSLTIKKEDKPIDDVNEKESSLYNQLKKYRLEKSREEKVKPYFLYSNSQLEAIVKAKPRTIEELKSIKGFGDVKCKKYGGDIVGIVNLNAKGDLNG